MRASSARCATARAFKLHKAHHQGNSLLQLLSKQLDSGGYSAMKTGQGAMIGFCFSEESTSSRRVILKIELELNNLNSILSRSAVSPAFPQWVQGKQRALALEPGPSTSFNINIIQHQHHSTSTSCNINIIQHQHHSTSTSFNINIIQHQHHSTSTSFNINVIQHQHHSATFLDNRT